MFMTLINLLMCSEHEDRSEAYLEPIRTSTMQLFSENSER